MKIDEILIRLNMEIEKQYGMRNAIHTVEMNHEAFDRIIIDLMRSDRLGWHSARPSARPSGMNDCKICGVRVNVREEKK